MVSSRPKEMQGVQGENCCQIVGGGSNAADYLFSLFPPALPVLPARFHVPFSCGILLIPKLRITTWYTSIIFHLFMNVNTLFHIFMNLLEELCTLSKG